MKKKQGILVLLLLTAVLLLCGCGSLFDEEYVVETEYTPVPQTKTEDQGRITVRSFSELRQALLRLVSAGETESQLVFDSAYEGDVAEDMASACWQVRTQDAMCAYCVENIAYELSKIVAVTEARVNVTYTDAGLHADKIVRMQVATGVEDQVRSCLSEGREQLVLLINRSSYTAETMEDLIRGVYRKDPVLVPRMPGLTVNMLSGSGTQRLYEINFNYGMTPEELAQKRAELAAFDPYADTDLDELGEGYRALEAYRYLALNCDRGSAAQQNSAYDALIGGEANSEGIALGYVALCDRLGLDCQVIYGQKNGQSHVWNILSLEGNHYHVDVCAYDPESPVEGFLLNDEAAWLNYRWDIYAYPRCGGSLRGIDFLPAVEESAEE